MNAEIKQIKTAAETDTRGSVCGTQGHAAGSDRGCESARRSLRAL